MTGKNNTSHIQPSTRISQFKTDFFVELGQRIAQLRSTGKDVIRLDMGSPDFAPPAFLIDVMKETLSKPNRHGYAPNGGTPQFKQAAAEYYQKRFGVQLDPSSQILGLLGSKSGLFSFAQVLLNPGDISLIPSPGYPTYTNACLFSDATPYYLPLLAENNYLPDLNNIPPDVLQKARLLWLNYPNNPTGALAPMSFLEEAVRFARKYNCFIAYDNPYSEVCFENYQPPSILQIPGAMDVCVEFNSLSKTYNIAGWRLGVAIGNPQLIDLLRVYSSISNSSQFFGIWDAGSTALTADQSWLIPRNQEYAARRDLVMNGLHSLGFEVFTPKATIYVWAKLPPTETRSSSQFCIDLLEQGFVSITPGSYYGEAGEGYVRFSLTTNCERISLGMERLATFLK